MVRHLGRRLELEIEMVRVKAQSRADAMERGFQAQLRSIRRAAEFWTSIIVVDVFGGLIPG